MTLATTNKNRDESLDFLKGVLISLVVLGYSIQFVQYAHSDRFWSDPLFVSIYTFHMPAFIAISGFLAGPKISSDSGISQFFNRRIAPILTPLLIWSLMIALVRIAKAHALGVSEASAILCNSILSSYWFLWAVIVGAVLARASVRFGRYADLVAGLLALSALLAPIASFSAPQIRFTAPFYLAGFVFSRAGLRISAVPLGLAMFAAVAAIGGAWGFWERQTYVYNNDLAYWRPENVSFLLMMLTVASASTLAFLRLGAAVFVQLRETLFAQVMLALGKRTLEIYLVQGLVFSASNSVPSLNLSPWLGTLTALSASFVVLSGVYLLTIALEQSRAFSRPLGLTLRRS